MVETNSNGIKQFMVETNNDGINAGVFFPDLPQKIFFFLIENKDFNTEKIVMIILFLKVYIRTPYLPSQLFSYVDP
jgi:hypothetical protein